MGRKSHSKERKINKKLWYLLANKPSLFDPIISIRLQDQSASGARIYSNSLSKSKHPLLNIKYRYTNNHKIHNNKWITSRTFLWYDTNRIENDAFNNSSIVACVFVAAVTSLPSRCLATRGGCTHRHTDRCERFMTYALKMGSCVMIYLPSFIQIGSGIQNLLRGIHRQHGDLISLLSFSKLGK
jgi:hypothetical protein